MKTIQIPTNCNPYIVVINNHVYTYKAGETIEVPDEVAEAIEDALELEPKPERCFGRLAQFVSGSITEVKEAELDGITNISRCAFYNYFNLISIEIPDSVTNIGNYAFDGCKSLTSVYLPNTPPTLAAVNSFASIHADCAFYCKTQASLEAYKKAENWSTLSGTYTFTLEP